jgi:hypothetical protein
VANDLFDFCPDYMVPETEPPSGDGKGVSFNGWYFSSKPRVPYQKSFVVQLQGMYWYLKGTGLFDQSTNPRYNARRLELFYEQHGLWKPFDFRHPHLGQLTVRFREPLKIPKAIPSSGGLIDAFEMKLVHHNPGY